MSTSAFPALPDERQQIILERLSRRGRVLAGDLAREFRTSEDTIRRDLRELAAAGKCRRVYGGALPLSPASGSLAARQAEAPERKAALGRAAAALVRPGQIVFIDAGSTNAAIARALPADLGVIVATNAPDIAADLVGRPGVELIVIGGRVDPRSGAALGARALRDAREIRVDLAFLGACAVDAEAGVAAFDAEEAEFKRLIAERAKAVAAAVTTDKLGTAAPFAVAPASRLTHLVVEADAPEGALAPLRRAGVSVLRAERVGEATR
ncbi:MAG: DeoR/GlpR family DNA-binding transcription regulator [Roseiarcus sp.]|jgi:DeoR/GlpR family transcriptional regulator of sugar metabolism